MKQYKLHHLPNHGYLAVPTKDLIESGVQKEISGYSFMSASGTTVYLEEDCDAGKFVDALRSKGKEWQIIHVLPSSMNKIKSMQRYQWS